MKKYSIILALIFGFQFVIAQEFTTTEKYVAVNELTTKQQEYTFRLVNIVAANDSSKKIGTIEIEDLDFFEELEITTLPNPNLDNVNEVIKVEVVYLACCAHTETYYFLATNDGEYTTLPFLENVYCDIEDTLTQYIFPNQEYGQKNSILTSAVKYTQTNTIKDMDILKKIVWNDDDAFDYEYAVTVAH